MAVYQDVTGKAEEKAIALGFAIGSGYLYKTTFEKEVFSDLYGGKEALTLIVLTRAVFNGSPMAFAMILDALLSKS